jgi:putative Ca2+/H+ antiporter (TMEM165/GDT1 family)
VEFAVVFAVFPIIFLGELPDKSMFASLVMAARGRPFAVWVGAASAFFIHVIIAVTIGVAVFKLLPQRLLDLVVAVMFGVSALLAFRAARPAPHAEPIVAPDTGKVAATAFGVIFVAEWGDLTQVLTANLAARYHAPLSVAVGATLALWTVAGLAVIGGHGLLSRLPTRPLRLITGSVLSVLALVSLAAAVL